MILSCSVSVGIVQELFLFNEDVGKAEVCVQLSGGVNANINVTLNSHEGTATSKILLLINTYNYMNYIVTM